MHVANPGEREEPDQRQHHQAEESSLILIMRAADELWSLISFGIPLWNGYSSNLQLLQVHTNYMNPHCDPIAVLKATYLVVK